jgi:hypothetical protein
MLDLPFKGGRRYLHGTDLFNALTTAARMDRNIDLRLYKPMLGPVCADRLATGAKAPRDILALLSCSSSGEVWVVREAVDAPSPSSIPYDEDAIAADASHSPGTIEQVEHPGASFIERTVALNKRLLAMEGLGSQWWFSRLLLERIPPRETPLRLRLARRLGIRLTESVIEAAHYGVGRIFFSAKT